MRDSRGRAEEWTREGKQNGEILSMGDGAGDPLSKGRRVIARKSGRVRAKPGGTAGALALVPAFCRDRGFCFCL